MGKTNDERTSSNEFKQLLLPEEKRNYILCSSTSSSIKDSSNSSISISASPASTTSHLSEYSSQTDAVKATDSSRVKPIKKNSSAGNLSLSLSLNSSSSTSEQTPPKTVNIKENKLNKENYALLLNDLENLKNYQTHQRHSSPSTKSSSINSLNQLIKTSPSANTNSPARPINRSLTCIGQNGAQVVPADRPTVKQINHQYFKPPENDRIRLSKSASTQSQNLNALESSNLPQSYSAVFNDNKQFDSRYDARFDNQFAGNQFNVNQFGGYQNSQFSYQNGQPMQPDNNQSTKISFKDSFYRKWFLSRFKPDNELNFDQTKSKRPKLVNLKRYNSIDLYENDAKRRADQDRSERSGDRENGNGLVPGPSGLQAGRNNSDDGRPVDGHQLRAEHYKIQQLTNPLHPYYLNAVGCADVDIDRWADASDTFDDPVSSANRQYLEDRNRAPAFVSTNNEPEKKEAPSDKLKRTGKHAQSPNEQAKNNKKSILLPNLHNEYRANGSHHKHHANENDSTTSTTRSSSTNSSNISSSSSTDCEKGKTAGNTLKPNDNDLSGSLSSVSSDMNTDPMLPICKICHLNAKEDDPLITPCRCSGSVQFIHAKCLMRWLEVCERKKSRKPLSCELCQYQYQWHKKFRVSIEEN